ncbi:MAG: MarR family transcriptional regulator [Methylobacteriaceae bacterium]|nr:MarR family transcriptional regulator [Methylobacteriaceae bacterium]
MSAQRRHPADKIPKARPVAKKLSATLGANPDAPIVETISSKLIVAANFLRRGATLRYRRLVGLPWVEYGIVAVLGRRKPVTVAGLAELLGMDKAQLSRALSNLVRRKLVERSANPQDSREVLVSLTEAGLATHETMVRAGFERNAYLLANLSAEEIAGLDRVLEELTRRAVEMLHAEQNHDTDAPPSE